MQHSKSCGGTAVTASTKAGWIPGVAAGWDPRYPDMANVEFDNAYLGDRIC
jgi:hypothetical protein